MTLCIAWRDTLSRVRFFSDSRVHLGNGAYSDFGIKVVRFPYNIYEPSAPGQEANLLQCGDIGITFCGTTVLPLMVKETFAEIMHQVQAIPGHSKYDIDSIARLLFGCFESIASDAACATNDRINVAVIFGAWCEVARRHRIYLMEVSSSTTPSYREILQNPNDLEIIGSGKEAAKAFLGGLATYSSIMDALANVINDKNVPSVGGNIQYGDFDAQRFRPHGVLQVDRNGAHYWRGMIDLNKEYFKSPNSLVPQLPLLDLR